MTELNDIQSEYSKVRKERINIEAQLNYISSLYNKDDIGIIRYLDNNIIMQLRQRFLSLKDEHAGLLKKYEKNHPFIIQKRIQMDEIRNSIAEELDKTIRSTKAEYNMLRTKELALEKEISKKRKMPSDLTMI